MLVKNIRISLIFVLFCVLGLSSCASSRREFAAGEIPQLSALDAADEEYGHQVLGYMMEQFTLDRDDSNITRVREMVEKLSDKANSSQLPWHVYVFKDDSIENAAATKGNYIFVWTGILKKAQNDDELAAVISHELAHLLAGHTQPTPEEEAASVFSEASGRVASEVLSQYGQYGALAGVASALTKALIDSIFVNPEQQRKELEADRIGLFLMAKADYDPDRAVDFWKKMNVEGSGDIGALQFMTSHPSSQERIDQLYALLPDARKMRPGATDSSEPAKGLESGKSKKHSADTEYSGEWTVK